MILARLDAGDWTAVAAVISVVFVVGGYLGKRVQRILDAKRTTRTDVRRAKAALWGSKKTDYDPEQPGLIEIVANLAKQVDQQGKEFDRRITRVEQGAST